MKENLAEIKQVRGQIKKVIHVSPKDQNELFCIIHVIDWDTKTETTIKGNLFEPVVGDVVFAEGIFGTYKDKVVFDATVNEKSGSNGRIELISNTEKYHKKETLALLKMILKDTELVNFIYKEFKNRSMSVILENELIYQKTLKDKGFDYQEVFELVNKSLKRKPITYFLKHECKLEKSIVEKIVKRHKYLSALIIKENPYQLLDDIEGLKFKAIDLIAKRLGVDDFDSRRLLAAAKYVLNEDIEKNKNCAITQQNFYKNFIDLTKIKIDTEYYNVFIKKLIEQKVMERDSIGEKNMVDVFFSRRMYDNRKNIVESINSIDKTPPKIHFVIQNIKDNVSTLSFGNNPEDKYNHEQFEAIESVFMNKITVITGGPGTGKTSVIEGILNANLKNYVTGLGCSVVIAAPTGKAANRIKASLRNSDKYKIVTIHSLIGKKPGSKPALHSENKVEADIIIIDEASMIDTFLFEELLDAISSTSRIVVVGDVNQLPSIDAGCILKDLINLGIGKIVKLIKPNRTGENSLIHKYAYMINNGETPTIENDIKDDFFFFCDYGDEDILQKIKELIDTGLKNFLEIDKKWKEKFKMKEEFKPIKHVQVLTPQHAGILGTNRLNSEIQKILIDKDDSVDAGFVDGDKFKVGDRVIQLKNNQDLDIYNGDVGIVHKINKLKEIDGVEQNVMEVLFDDKVNENEQPIITRLKQKDVKDLKLAYAMTVHKSQGSEYPIVIIPVTHTFGYVTRKMLYTAVTRSRKMVILIGNSGALARMVYNTNDDGRITGLDSSMRDFEISSI